MSRSTGFQIVAALLGLLNTIAFVFCFVVTMALLIQDEATPSRFLAWLAGTVFVGANALILWVAAAEEEE